MIAGPIAAAKTPSRGADTWERNDRHSAPGAEIGQLDILRPTLPNSIKDGIAALIAAVSASGINRIMS